MFKPGKSHGQGSLVGYSPWGHSRTWLKCLSTSHIQSSCKLEVSRSPQISCQHREVFAMLCYAKSLQSWPILCDPMDCSLPGSSIHGIFQARVLEWGAIAFSTEKFLQGVILWTQHPESNRLWTLNYLQSCQTPLSQNTHVSLFLNPTFWRQPQDK